MGKQTRVIVKTTFPFSCRTRHGLEHDLNFDTGGCYPVSVLFCMGNGSKVEHKVCTPASVIGQLGVEEFSLKNQEASSKPIVKKSGHGFPFSMVEGKEDLASQISMLINSVFHFDFSFAFWQISLLLRAIFLSHQWEKISMVLLF